MRMVNLSFLMELENQQVLMSFITKKEKIYIYL